MDFVHWLVANLAEPLWLASEPISEIGYGQGKVTAVMEMGRQVCPQCITKLVAVTLFYTSPPVVQYDNKHG
jgi:hypothetical protein